VLKAIDWKLWTQGLSFCGIDEVGRGALAGPVVACAIILPPFSYFSGLKDSKKLSSRQRDDFYRLIKMKAQAFAIGMASPTEIDRLNIRNATFLAMRRALTKLLKKNPDCRLAIVDGFRIPKAPIPTQGIIKGDEQSISIACASIIAKVTRDRLMARLAQKYPRYDFEVNKGYPTVRHRQVISEFGPSVVHRYSFGPVKKVRTLFKL
jgi:ribonuclease HII